MTVDAKKLIGNFLLTEKAIDQIDFSIGLSQRIQVNSRRLRYVGELIKSGQMRIALEDLSKDDSGGGYDGTYDFFIFDESEVEANWNSSSFHDRMWIRGVVIHEATHAGNELSRRSIFQHRDEAAAYIAGSIYWHYHGASGLFTKSKIIKEAGGVVKVHGLCKKRGVRLLRSDIAGLLRAIRQNSNYDDYSPLFRNRTNALDSPWL